MGSDVYWDGAWDALTRFAETMRVPCWFNGLGRGCLPADHELAFTRTRALLKSEADLVVVIGTALDFRLGFGRFGDAPVVHICDAPESRAAHVATAASPAGDLTAILDGMTAWSGSPQPTTSPGSPECATPSAPRPRPSGRCSRPRATRSSPTASTASSASDWHVMRS